MHSGVLPRELDGRLIGLSARVAEECLVREGQLHQPLGELDLCSAAQGFRVLGLSRRKGVSASRLGQVVCAEQSARRAPHITAAYQAGAIPWMSPLVTQQRSNRHQTWHYKGLVTGNHEMTKPGQCDRGNQRGACQRVRADRLRLT